MSDAPLASATLAQLYLAQGHPDQAAQIVDELLAKNPHDGHALALRTRMHHPAAASLELLDSSTAGPIRVRYRIGELESTMGPAHVLLATAGLRPDQRAIRVTSIPCEGPAGMVEFRRPGGPGSARLALGCLRDGALRILAQSTVASWS